MSEHRISETDWKRWKDLSEKALDRYFEKILKEAGGFVKVPGNPRERYRKLFNFIEDTEEVLGIVFNDQRRTTAAVQLAEALDRGLIEEKEFQPFSQETRELVRQLRKS